MIGLPTKTLWSAGSLALEDYLFDKYKGGANSWLTELSVKTEKMEGKLMTAG